MATFRLDFMMDTFLKANRMQVLNRISALLTCFIIFSNQPHEPILGMGPMQSAMSAGPLLVPKVY